MIELPEITCAKCGRPVDEIVLVEDFVGDGIWMIVSCHGSREQTTLPRSFFADRMTIVGGRAFVDQIEHREEEQ